MKYRYAVFFVLLFFTTHPVFSQYPAIHEGRPRIMADADRLAILRDKSMSSGEYQNVYQDLQYRYDHYWITDPLLYQAGSDSSLWSWDWYNYYTTFQAQISSLLYKINNDPLELKRIRFQARATIDIINTTDWSQMEWFAKEELLRKISDVGGLLLDWHYDSLPIPLREQLTSAMYFMNREFMQTFITSDAGYSFVSSHNTWNHIFANQNALVLHGATALTNLQQDTVTMWCRHVYDKLDQGFFPCWAHYRDDDGGWNWGAAYAMWSFGDQFQLFENMRIGTDKNLYHDLPWLRESINQYLYFIQPDGKTIHLGDGVTNIIGDRVMYLHARHFQDARSRWLAQYWSHPNRTPNTIDVFWKLLYHDLEANTVAQPTLPLHWWSDKVGLAVRRSSWSDDATMITFFNSPSKRAAHEHRDNNSVSVYKHAPLLVDAGYYDTYGGSHYVHYYHRSIAHNTICVFDEKEQFYYYGQAIANDGGQIESPQLMNYEAILAPENQRGQWLHYTSEDDITYYVADAQQSYHPDKLSLFRRRVLCNDKDKMLILDHVHLKNTNSEQRDIQWLAHFVNRPEIYGTPLSTTVPGQIETYSARDYRIVNGRGNMAIRTLLPEHSTTTMVGGSGYEYYVNGVNYPPDVIPDTSYYAPGSWRIEVRPAEVSDTVIYLHTFDIGDDVSQAVAGGDAIDNAFSVGADWDNTLFLFAADGDTGVFYHRVENVPGNRILHIVAADLLPDKYYLKINGVAYEEVVVANSGLLRTTIDLPSGNHLIEISRENIIAVKTPPPLTLKVFPSPAKNELFIESPTIETTAHLYIYNAEGHQISVGKFRNRIDIRILPPGTYTVVVRINNVAYTGRFTK